MWIKVNQTITNNIQNLVANELFFEKNQYICPLEMDI